MHLERKSLCEGLGRAPFNWYRLNLSLEGSNPRAKYMKSRNIYPSLPSILRNNPTRPSISCTTLDRYLSSINLGEDSVCFVVICTTWRNKQRLLACTRANPRERSLVRSESSPVRPLRWSGGARSWEVLQITEQDLPGTPHREPVRVRSLTKWGSNNNTLGSRGPKIDGARCEWIIW